MIKIVRLLSLIGAFAVAQALAAGPESSSTDPANSPQSSEAAAQPAASASQSSASTGDKSQSASSASQTSSDTAAKSAQSSTSKPVVLNDKTLTQAQVNQLLSRGFKPKTRGDSVIYCRRETKLNSRFETEVCRTAEQIALEERDSREMVEQMQRTGGVPQGR